VARTALFADAGGAIAGIRDGCRDMAKGDEDFDPIRAEPASTRLIGS
jgi:hypothetical protein